MSDTVATRKQIKIKSGVVKRYQKELELYRKEVTDGTAKLESLKVSGGDDWDTRNAASLVRESENMVRDTGTRLEKATGELEDLLNSAKRNTELAEDEELREAEATLAAARSS
ncbi:tubulin binding cofactor A [Gloeopeniophorella convolvens]|nr:tubulin binding cofactor A [Gloeopeniophorella convolvens]